MRFHSITISFVILACAMIVHAHPATGIVVDSKKNIYFSDLETVWRVDQSGQLTIFRPGDKGRHVHELAIDKDDNIYGADISYVSEKFISSVWKMTPNGDLTYLLEPMADLPRGMSLWFDAQGNMYWVDQNNHTKTRTLLLRREPNGTVSTLAGSAYGHADGIGTQARFGSIGGMTFGPDGNIYLTDSDSVRKVTMDGTVTTLAKELTVRTSKDYPTLFGGNHGSLAGLTVANDGTVFVADSGNRRVLRVMKGKVDVVLRSEPPFFPTGAAATASGEVYVLEVGLTLPNIASGPRVRRLSPDGTVAVVAIVGEDRDNRTTTAVAVERAGIAAESALQFVWDGRATKYLMMLLLIIGTVFVWRWRRRERHV
jgi:sugar lactone lactonase YvrE